MTMNPINRINMKQDQDRSRWTAQLELIVITLQRTYDGGLPVEVAIHLLKDSGWVGAGFQESLEVISIWCARYEREATEFMDAVVKSRELKREFTARRGLVAECQFWDKIDRILGDTSPGRGPAYFREIRCDIYEQVHALTLLIAASSEAHFNMLIEVDPLPLPKSEKASNGAVAAVAA